MRWDIWKIFFPNKGVFFTKVMRENVKTYIITKISSVKTTPKTPKMTNMRHVCMWCVLVLLCEEQSLDWESRRPRWWLEKCWRARVLSLSNSLSSDPTATAKKKQYGAKVRVAISPKVLQPSARKIWITYIQAFMPYESSEDSSNQSDGAMGSPGLTPPLTPWVPLGPPGPSNGPPQNPKQVSWPHRTPNQMLLLILRDILPLLRYRPTPGPPWTLLVYPYIPWDFAGPWPPGIL